VRGNDLDEEEFRRAVDDNVTSGSMTLIIAVDDITDELKRIVSYLNSHTTTNVELLALEMQRAVDEGVEVLIPAIYGEESARTKTRSDSRGPRLDRETLLASIREQSELAGDAAEGILDWANDEPRLDVDYSRATASLRTAGKNLLRIMRSGYIRVGLQTLSDHAAWDTMRIEQLVHELDDIGVQLGPNRNRPRAPFEPLADDTRRQQFLALMERVLDTLTTSP
jgi:hypothetical protein